MEESNLDVNKLKEENKSLSEALKQVLYQNEMLLGWVNGGVVTVDHEGQVLSANEFAIDSHASNLDDMVGKHYHESFHHTLDDGGEYPWDFCPVFAAIEDGSSHHVTGDVFWKTDGTSFIVDYIVCPIRDEKNKISGASILFRDLTKRRLEEAKKIHGLKLESIGELSAGIAHEINTPIQFIGSNISFMEEVIEDLFSLIDEYKKLSESISVQPEYEDSLNRVKAKEDEIDLEYLKEEAPKTVDQTSNGVNRVAELVQGLKGFSHSSDSDQKSNVNINDIINSSLIVSKNTYKYVAELEFEQGQIPDVKANHGDIGQVILNLVINASHAIEAVKGDSNTMGKIKITSYQDNDFVVVKIADTGGGVCNTVKDRIFDPFFTTKVVGKGSGQGLAISRTIIHDKHNGELSFESEEGVGTTFFIRLPIKG